MITDDGGEDASDDDHDHEDDDDGDGSVSKGALWA